jgi:membrane associated rhomboid family serine protease
MRRKRYPDAKLTNDGMTIKDRGGDEPLGLEEARPPREPAVRAPWPALLLAASFLVLYPLQSFVGSDLVVSALGFSPLDLAHGRLYVLVTALFVHGGWAHAFLNALGSLAFGAPVARLFGKGAAGVLGFFAFFLICGAISSLGYAALHWGAPYVLVGASGAVSGFMGAASRLMEGPWLSRFTSRPVLSMAAAWVLVNLIVAMVGLGAVAGDAPIAWEAHLVGYAAGLLLVGPFVRLLGRG